jgi:hypothetical protein
VSIVLTSGCIWRIASKTSVRPIVGIEEKHADREVIEDLPIVVIASCLRATGVSFLDLCQSPPEVSEFFLQPSDVVA